MKEIPLTKGKVALVDDEDYDFLMQWKWSAFKTKITWYAQRGSTNADPHIGRRYTILMHRVIMKAKLFEEVDHHPDHNGLNNQRSNLRIATKSQNKINVIKKNSTGYRGVQFNKNNKNFVAHIRIDGKIKHLGAFKTAIEAALAYNTAATKYHGKFAILNVL